jgi:hypothetical protein
MFKKWNHRIAADGNHPQGVGLTPAKLGKPLAFCLLRAADRAGLAAQSEIIKAQIITAQIIQERNAMTSLSLLALLGRIFDPLAALLDEAASSASAREAARVKLAAVKADAFSAALAFEEDRLATAARLVAAKAGGQSWLQRNWRPLTMLCFLFLVMADSFGLLAFRLSAEAWGLLQIGLGGYVVGRSVEKIAPQIKSSLNSKRG